MASVKNIERDIRALEGFEVVIRTNGTNVRKLPDYDYGRAARSRFTVDDWKRSRFERNYPEIQVDVLRPDGRVATAKTVLSKLRAEYEAG